MIKRLLVGIIACAMMICAVPVTANAIQYENFISSADLAKYGWQKSGERLYTQSNVLYIGDGSTSGGKVHHVAQPAMPRFDKDDGATFPPLNGIVESATAEGGYFVITEAVGFVGQTGNKITVIFTKENVRLDKNPGEMGGDSYYTFEYRLEVVKGYGGGIDQPSINQGWITGDGGKNYYRTYDIQQVTESMPGNTIPVALPGISTTGSFDSGDVAALDSVAASIIQGIRIDSQNRVMYITFSKNAVSYSGTSFNLVLRKNLMNAQGAWAGYTLTLPFRVGVQSKITVNGLAAPATITVTRGSTTGLKVANVNNLMTASVHWTTDATGRYDVTNMINYPVLGSDGMINVSTLGTGVYYFYITNITGQNSGVYTLKVENGGQIPTSGMIYRVMDPITEERLLTTSSNEVGKLQSKGWILENSPGYSGGNVAVYRLYNIKTGEHLYTSDLRERTYLTQRDWIYDNNGRPMFYAAKSGPKPMYRLYNNKKMPQGSHLYTTDRDEVIRLTASLNWLLDNAGRPYFYLQ